MRDAGQREEQFRKRIQPNTTEIESPMEIPPAASSTSSPSFHTPTVEQSPSVVLPVEDKPSITVSPLVVQPIKPTETGPRMTTAAAAETTQVTIRYTATEETTQAEYRPGIKLVQSNVLKSTIQNYMIDHHSLDENDEEELPEKVYDWDSIISNGPQFTYEDTFGKSPFLHLPPLTINLSF